MAEFEKPKGDPTAFLKPATTCLSPYLKVGTLCFRQSVQRTRHPAFTFCASKHNYSLLRTKEHLCRVQFGCVSARLFYHKLLQVYKQSKNHTRPPVSLEGQVTDSSVFALLDIRHLRIILSPSNKKPLKTCRVRPHNGWPPQFVRSSRLCLPINCCSYCGGSSFTPRAMASITMIGWLITPSASRYAITTVTSKWDSL